MINFKCKRTERFLLKMIQTFSPLPEPICVNGEYHFIYLTINALNGCFYIGKHSTKDLNDGYIGSGIKLNKAIRKHGEDNFISLKIVFAKSEDEIFDLEARIVNEKIINTFSKELQTCYNIDLGGKGGKVSCEQSREKILPSKSISILGQSQIEVDAHHTLFKCIGIAAVEYLFGDIDDFFYHIKKQNWIKDECRIKRFNSKRQLLKYREDGQDIIEIFKKALNEKKP